MNEVEHLLVCLMEGCAEIQERASKALRFGLDEIEHGQDANNEQRIVGEIWDLVGVIEELQDHKALRGLASSDAGHHIGGKRQKLRKFMAYARECGTLSDPVSETDE